MQLSVVIVSYNVGYFLEQCLHAVRLAGEGLTMEVIVVDNASSDGTREQLPPRFPEVRFLLNAQNVGFAKASNQGLEVSRGQYLLLLNPDTLVTEQAFHRCIRFMEAHPEAGAVGMRMYDGRGNYLPESKRGFPGGLSSFYKMSGLVQVFPRHPVIAHYYLGHLPSDQVQEVEVLAGAFLMVRGEVFAKVGGLDERFFMYGEDIDWSYRIRGAGYRNYYLPDPGIIHFKGESSLRDPDYIRHFYRAMELFVEKHYHHRGRWWRVVLQQAIGIRMALARLLWRPSGGASNAGPVKWVLAGAADSIAEARQGLPAGSILEEPPYPGTKRPVPETSSGRENYRLGICIGEGFTMEAALDYLRERAAGVPARFHFLGSRSFVGSDDPNSSGETVLLKKEPLV